MALLFHPDNPLELSRDRAGRLPVGRVVAVRHRVLPLQDFAPAVRRDRPRRDSALGHLFFADVKAIVSQFLVARPRQPDLLAVVPPRYSRPPSGNPQGFLFGLWVQKDLKSVTVCVPFGICRAV